MEKDIIAVFSSNTERKLELSAWEKLSSYIIKHGWVMKGRSSKNGGYRLYFDKNKNPHKTVTDPNLRSLLHLKK